MSRPDTSFFRYKHFYLSEIIGFYEVVHMAYRIEYDSFNQKFEISSPVRSRFPGLLIGAVTAFFLITATFWPEGWSALRDIMIPGDDAVTLQALECMSDNLRSGMALEDAITSFCREVIDGASGSY